ncbi:MAG: HAD-IA family hydrolase [Clostridia bacterium]|nr:HAD-IA family hydrolase [Clostridia bacterium]
MKYDAIFFDLDGTVIDSLQDIADAVNHTMRHFGLPEYAAEALKPHLGWGVGTLMRRLLPACSDARLEEILAFYKPYYAAHTRDKSRPFEGILPMLARLKADGLALAIISNKPDAAVQPLARAFFSDVVSLAMGETEGVRRKPQPDMLEMAARKLGLDLSRCLYVGDSEVDIDTAKNTGIDCVCVTWGFRSREALIAAGATRVIDAPAALVTFVESAQG